MDYMPLCALNYRSEYGHIFTNAYNIINYNSECKISRAEVIYKKIFERYGNY